MKKYGMFFPLLFLVVTSLAAPGSVNAGDPAESISFKWAFIYKESPAAEEKVIDFSGTPRIKSGGQLRIYLDRAENTYLYLFLEDSGKDVALLYPESPDQYGTKAPPRPGPAFIPGAAEWFDIDDSTGPEKFYLLASSTRLTRLEELTSNALAQEGNPELRAQVLEEIKNIRKAHSTLASGAEKGVPIAGTIRTRDLSSQIGGIATQVEAETFYGKTLRLEHE